MLLDRIKMLCREKGISQRKLEQLLDLGNGATSKWAKSSPSMETVNKMADYFHVSVDYLLGNVSEPYFHLDNKRILKEINSSGDEDNFDPDTVRFAAFSGFELDKENVDLIMQMAKRLHDQQQLVKKQENGNKK